MARRPPSSPPEIAGFEHVRLLGSGGFADVFLYQQVHPRRQVAVKVLLRDKVGTSTAQGFTDEANLMAALSTHPSIVSVYGAGVAGDGRPYMVMEYCSRKNLQARHREERFSQAETLRVGIQIAGAVETAHGGGILHRDIKPANVLVTDYGRPALTDFGISAAVGGQLEGMSVPWSPPESFRVPAEGDASSDVYSLAATLYTLLTDRSPFEIAGASNSEIDVIARIQSAQVPPIGRPDVSTSLEAVLQRAMAKAPAARYASAIEFARALQRVQIELGMQPTPIDVMEEDVASAAEDDDDDGRTRFRGITSIDAQGEATVGRAGAGSTVQAASSTVPTVAPTGAALAGGAQSDTVLRPGTPAPGIPASARPAVAPARVGAPTAPPLDDTVHRPASPVTAETMADPAADASGRRRRALTGWVIGGGVLAVAAGVAVALVLAPGNDTPAPTEPTGAAPLDVVPDDAAPQVEDLAGTIAGSEVTFTWSNPAPADGDTYLWRPVVIGESFTYSEVDSPEVTMDADAAGRTCIEVVLRRADGGTAADSVTGCAP